MKKIAFFISAMEGGGAERVVLNLLKGMLSGDVSLDLVIADAHGPYLEQIPEQVRIINLGAKRVIKAIVPLSDYLQKNKPSVLISHMSHVNVVAVMANKLAGTKTQLILVEHDTLSATKFNLIRGRFVPLFMKLLYPHADAIVGVSEAASRDLETQIGLKKGSVKTIYNPVVDCNLISQAQADINHPWFEPGTPPVFLAIGRLTLKKDFLTLIKAFSIFRKTTKARLIILGEGELRDELTVTIKTLGVADDVSLPGFVTNPYAYMSKADAFILSSRWEGLPTVLIEAMACGCPVISTDCPSGPREILEGEKYGHLVSVGDVEAMSEAMFEVLQNPQNKQTLMQRAMYFSVDKAVENYFKLLA